MNHEMLSDKIAEGIYSRQRIFNATKAEFDAAVRLQLGYPDHEPLPSDPLFQKLHRQICANYIPKVNIDLDMVPTKKKAMILLAIHSILTR